MSNTSKLVRDLFRNLDTRGVKFSLTLMEQVNCSNKSLEDLMSVVKGGIKYSFEQLVSDSRLALESWRAEEESVSMLNPLDQLDLFDELEEIVSQVSETISTRIDEVFEETEKKLDELLQQIENESFNLVEANQREVVNLFREVLTNPLRSKERKSEEKEERILGQRLLSKSFVQCGGTG